MTKTLAVVMTIILGTWLSNPSKTPSKFERMKAYFAQYKSRREPEIIMQRKAIHVPQTVAFTSRGLYAFKYLPPGSV